MEVECTRKIDFRKPNNKDTTKNNNNQDTSRRSSTKETLSRIFSSGRRDKEGKRRTLPELIDGLKSEEGQQGRAVEIQNLPRKMSHDEEAMFNEYLSHRRCPKNPGHPTFIPLSDIKKSILPSEARHDVIVKIIKDTGLRSVKLTVYYTTDRPTRFAVGLPAGSKNGRLGTGWIELFDQTMDKLPGYKPGQTFVISTAAHVIFDKKEAKKTKVEFFYDEDGDKSGVVTAWGVSLILVNTSLDVCRFMCKTNNKDEGNRILQKLNSVPRTYPLIPPMKNIAWCVSHPHGFSKRVTLGKITSVIEDEPSWSSNLLKLLVFRCCIEQDIDERKVFYVFFKDSANGISVFVLDGLSEIAKLEQRQQYLRHLLSNGLIDIPTEKETTRIKTEYFHLLKIIVTERDVRLKFRYRKSSKNDELNNTLFKLIVTEMAMQTPTFQHFQEMYDDVEKGLWSKKHELLFGTNSQPSDLARTKSIVYDLDSCPGSSGARVTAYLRTMMGCRRFMGFHSRGLKGCHGNMCGGGGSRIVPTLPITLPPPPTRKQQPWLGTTDNVLATALTSVSTRSLEMKRRVTQLPKELLSSKTPSIREIVPSEAQSEREIIPSEAQSRMELEPSDASDINDYL